MFNKVVIYSMNTVHELKDRAISRIKNRKGMEMLQMVLIIAIAAALGVLFWVFVKSTLFDTFRNTLMDKLNQMFDSSNGEV